MTARCEKILIKNGGQVRCGAYPLKGKPLCSVHAPRPIALTKKPREQYIPVVPAEVLETTKPTKPRRQRSLRSELEARMHEFDDAEKPQKEEKEEPQKEEKKDLKRPIDAEEEGVAKKRSIVLDSGFSGSLHIMADGRVEIKLL